MTRVDRPPPPGDDAPPPVTPRRDRLILALGLALATVAAWLLARWIPMGPR